MLSESLEELRRIALERDRPLVIWERLAHGGGATNWYVVRNEADCRALEALVRSGSELHAFAGEALRVEPVTQTVREAVVALADRLDEVVLGRTRDGPQVDAYLIDPSEVHEQLEDLDDGVEVLWGAIPDIGSLDELIVIDVADPDGVVRHLPH